MDNLSCGLKIQVIIQITIYLYISYDVVVFFILILHDDHTIYIYRERDEMIRYIWWCQKKKKQGEMETSANVTGLEKHLSIDIN